MSAVWTAIAVAIVGPAVILMLQGRQAASQAEQRAVDRREDWARQDLIAERLEKRDKETAAAAHAVAVQTQTAAQLLLQNNEAVAASTRAANTKLDVIHTLVNSNMTAALQDSLDSARANLATLRELIGVRVAQGEEPDADTRKALSVLEDKVGRLAANLKDRIEQTKVADAQIFVAREQTFEDIGSEKE